MPMKTRPRGPAQTEKVQANRMLSSISASAQQARREPGHRTLRSFQEPLNGEKGVLVVSLDFELYWGVRDIASLDQVREKLIAARAAIPALLKLFADYEIHATWATVGMLFFNSKNELARSLPEPPRYARPDLSPYGEMESLGSDEATDPCHYAQSLIDAIRATPHQEIGTHTFSHFYCLEDGQDLKSFRADLRAAFDAARRAGIELKSLVFPRNQVNPDYLEACAELGIKTYRGTNYGWMYAPRKRHLESQFRRAVRLLDAHWNVSGHNTYEFREIHGAPMNLPASRYIGMYSRWLAPFEALRIRRIRREMLYAARRHRIYHLWFHPEDIGANPERGLALLRKVFDTYIVARERGAIESLTMNELYQKLTARKRSVGAEAICASSAGGLE